MKLRSSNWLAGFLFAVVGAMAGCAVSPDRSAGDDPAVEEVTEAALTAPGGAMTNVCTPNGQEPPGGGGGLCGGGGARIFPNPACCSGRAKFFCPARGEGGEVVCVP